MDKFVHLHLHTQASLLDGLTQIKPLIAKAKELGHSAVAITEHGNIFSAINFYKECKRNDIKPILGIEVYCVEDCKEAKRNKDRENFHLVALAMNNKGWRNIIRMVTASNKPENFYYVPRVDLDILKEYSEGVILLTGCMSGPINHYLMLNNQKEAMRWAKTLYDIYGDRLYFEVQNAALTGQFEINKQIRDIAKKIGRPTVATVDSHYLTRDDAIAHIELKVMSTKDRKSVLNSGYGQSSEFYYKSRDEINLSDKEKDCTLKIADRCNVEIDLSKRRFPSYIKTKDEPEDGHEDLLRYKLREGWKRKLNARQRRSKEYKERANKELGDIIEAGFVDYFLIVADIVNWAKSQNIYVGPSRGSVAGSLLAYLLNITEVDPLKYGLIFERFYNKGRINASPDIDIDIELRHRKEVIDYIRERFGQDKVAQLITFNTLAARAVLKDIMRVNGISFEKANEVTDHIPLKSEEHGSISLEEALRRSKKLREYSEDPEYKKCFEYAIKMEGISKSVGTHAAAVVISDTPFDEGELPLVRSPDGKDMVVGWDMKNIDDLNVLKCDILGLATLEVLHRTIDVINKRYEQDIGLNDLYNLQDGDEKTYELICKGWVDGVFQIETYLGKKWAEALLPKSIDDISSLIALVRPGTLDNGMVEEYRKVRMGEKSAEYIHSSLEPILSKTNGVLVYQECVIDICNKIAKMSLEDSDQLRKAMGKKLPEEMKKWNDVFVDNIIKNSNISKEDAMFIWDNIEPHAGYSFCRGHSIAYSIISYWTAFFKANYTLEFLCSCLICTKYNQKPLEEIKRFVNDAKLFGIKILPPSIKHGNMNFDINENDNIRFGLSNLKGVGKNALKKVMKSEVGNNFYEFIFNNQFNKQVIMALILSGSLDCFDIPRYKMLHEYSLYKELTHKQQEIVKSLIFEGESSVIKVVRQMVDQEPEYWKNKNIRPPNVRAKATLGRILREYDGKSVLSSVQILDYEKEYLGVSISPLNTPFKGSHDCLQLKKYKITNTQVELVGYIVNIKEVLTKKNKQEMAFISIEDNSYMLDGITIFPNTYEKIKNLLSVDRLVRIFGHADENSSLICDKVEVL